MQNYSFNVLEFLEREKLFLKYLQFRPNAPKIARAAQAALLRFDASGFSFETSWDVIHYDRIIELNVAGLLHLNPGGEVLQHTYSFSVSQDKSLIRRYHFDHENNRGRDKPLFHLHYGGKPLPSQIDYNGRVDLNPGFSEPRLFATPMSLALVLEQVFLEFPDEVTDKLYLDNHWKHHVLESQKKILKPYFEECIRLVSNNERIYSQCYH